VKKLYVARHNQTNRYYAEDGEWTFDVLKAKHFSTRSNAERWLGWSIETVPADDEQLSETLGKLGGDESA
jgi:hypothetical protein